MDVSFGDKGEDWIEIIVDSAAEESVCPYEWGKGFGKFQTKLGRVSRKDEGDKKVSNNLSILFARVPSLYSRYTYSFLMPFV